MESKIKLLEELKLKHSDFEIGTDHDDVERINKTIDEISRTSGITLHSKQRLRNTRRT